MIEYDRNSWHMRLYEVYGRNGIHLLQAPNQMSFCEYFWRVAYGALIAILLAIVGGWFGTVLLQFFGTIIGYIVLPWPVEFGLFEDLDFFAFIPTTVTHGAGLLYFIGVINVVISMILGICIVACSIILPLVWAINKYHPDPARTLDNWWHRRVEAYHDWLERSAKNPDAGFFATAYVSFKKKYCPMVGLKRPEAQ